MNMLAPGVWPTMITPFTEEKKIDYPMVEKLVEWYIERGVAGIFAVCQSSEMFFLDDREKIELAAFIKKVVNGRIGLIASGHTADSLEDQAAQVSAMADVGVENVVLLPNRFAAPDEDDGVLKANFEKLLKMVDSSITFGFYECPHPYKRVLSPEMIAYLADTNRVSFMKDTCCDANLVIEKIRAGRGIVRIYNANCSQLLITLKAGAAGFSGVMANFHPEAYSWLCANFEKEPELAQSLSNFLGIASCIEGRMYPVCAKKYLKAFFFPEMSDMTRSFDRDKFVPSFYTEILQLNELYGEYLACKGLDFGVRI